MEHQLEKCYTNNVLFYLIYRTDKKILVLFQKKYIKYINTGNDSEEESAIRQNRTILVFSNDWDDKNLLVSDFLQENVEFYFYLHH